MRIAAIELMAKPAPVRRPRRASIRPCVRPAVDGIFRPGGGGPGGVSWRDVGASCRPPIGKNQLRAQGLRDGG